MTKRNDVVGQVLAEHGGKSAPGLRSIIVDLRMELTKRESEFNTLYERAHMLESQVRDLTRDEADRKLVRLARNQELGKLRDDWNAALKRAEKAEAEVRDLTGERDRLQAWKTSALIQLGEADKLMAVLPTKYLGHDVHAAAIAEIKGLRDTVERLERLLNTPEVEDFDKAVPLEAAHQQLRWGAEHDSGKNPEDWFWLVGYLAGKALASFKAGNFEKAKHHTISTSAALRNWHAHIRSGQSEMRPGIAEPKV